MAVSQGDGQTIRRGRLPGSLTPRTGPVFRMF